MAKRISSFSKEWVDKDGNSPANKDIIKFLENRGIEGKTASSNITDEEAASIAGDLKSAGFSSATAQTQAKPQAAVKPAEKAETAKPEAEKPAAKPAAPKAPAAAAVAASAKDNAPVKKKKIIIVGGAGNQGRNFPPRSSQPYPGRNDQSVQRGPIKPRENLLDRAGIAAKRNAAEEPAVPETVETPAPAPVAEAAPQVKENTAQVATAPVKTEPAAPVANSNANNEGSSKPAQQTAQTAQTAPSPVRRDRNEGGNSYQSQGSGDRNFAPRNNNGQGYQGNRPAGGRDFRQGGDRNGFAPRQNQGYQGGRPGQGGFNQGGNRSFQGGRPGQGGLRPQGGRGAAAPAPMPAETGRRNRHNEKERERENRRDMRFDEEERGRDRNSAAGRFIKPVAKKVEEPVDDIKMIKVPDTITIKEFAERMHIQPAEIVKKLFMQGEMVTVNQEIDFEKAEEIAIDYEIICEKEEKVDVIAELLKEDEEDEKKMVPRPPVICVMGHVDHGKTSLLDAIRKTSVTSHEAGGITQKIGAYTVKVGDRKITFLDTPGHEAFTAMRMRGANSTDIAVLVVAADDGVMPQTVEAINHAKAAGIELIVAVNKIDKPGANIDRVKQELTEYELVSEDWGGSTIFVPVSAKSGEGIDKLLEMILLTADVLELKADPNRKARGLVIEAELDKGRGPVATVLVQKGTLKIGDFVSAGASHGKVRAMIDDKGRRVKEAGPSTPVEILGLSDVPNAGEIIICHHNEKEAKSFADTFITQNKEKLLADTKAKMSLDDLFDKIKEGSLKELNLIVKADVQGSVEAVRQSLEKLSNDEVIVKVIHGGVGAINESDVVLASASNAIIIGFDVRPDAVARQTAEHEGVDIRLYNVIYKAIEDVEAAMKGMLEPVYEEKVIGHAEVRAIFKASAIGNIAGAFVMDGMIQKGCKVRITREGEQIFEGSLKSLKRFKDDVKEVKEGFECGLVFDGFDSIQELDMVEAYIMVEVPRD